jgi:hypothetical protein
MARFTYEFGETSALPSSHIIITLGNCSSTPIGATNQSIYGSRKGAKAQRHKRGKDRKMKDRKIERKWVECRQSIPLLSFCHQVFLSSFLIGSSLRLSAFAWDPSILPFSFPLFSFPNLIVLILGKENVGKENVPVPPLLVPHELLNHGYKEIILFVNRCRREFGFVFVGDAYIVGRPSDAAGEIADFNGYLAAHSAFDVPLQGIVAARGIGRVDEVDLVRVLCASAFLCPVRFRD